MDSESRFEFGSNWSRFLAKLNDDRINQAIDSLRVFLDVDDLDGMRFLDIGSGSGLFSLAARRLGASVTSFDYDPQSVACTMELKRRYYPDDPAWRIEQGSALDIDYLRSLGKFDVVYSWGVLHHTGAMWLGIEYAIQCVRNQGMLYVAIYNDQGWKSHVWWLVKLMYNKLPGPLRRAYVATVAACVGVLVVLKYTLKLRPMVGLASLAARDRQRGMMSKFDRVDWIGGFPYEFARFEVLVSYFESRNFELTNGSRNNSLGCHELAFRRLECAG